MWSGMKMSKLRFWYSCENWNVYYKYLKSFWWYFTWKQLKYRQCSVNLVANLWPLRLSSSYYAPVLFLVLIFVCHFYFLRGFLLFKINNPNVSYKICYRRITWNAFIGVKFKFRVRFGVFNLILSLHSLTKWSQIYGIW